MAATLLALGGCERRISIGNLARVNRPGTDAGDAGRDASVRTDAGSGASDAGFAVDGSVDACNLQGPLLAVGDGPGPSCAGGKASRAFRFAACSCDDFVNSASVRSDAFGTAATPGPLSNGSLGMNGAFYPLTATLDGSLVVAGSDGIPTQGPLTIGGSLRDQGQLDGQFAITIDGDAEVGADLRVKTLTLGGTLTVNAGSAVDVTDGNPAFTRGTVDIAAPCDCAGGPDLAALVASAKSNNDNAAQKLDANESFRSLDAPIELTLPCGSYYADAFYAPNPITLTITGRVALYVAGDFVTEQGGAVRVQLAPGAQLDLVIAGNLSTGDLLELGTSATKGRVRVYTGGAGSLSFAGNTTIAGTLYAPNAELVASATFETFGAVLARRISTSGDLELHYDRALADGVCESTL